MSLQLSFQILNGDQDFQLFDIRPSEMDIYYLVIISKDLSIQVIPEQRL
jgi:hypothetical protein